MKPIMIENLVFSGEYERISGSYPRNQVFDVSVLVSPLFQTSESLAVAYRIATPGMRFSGIPGE